MHFRNPNVILITGKRIEVSRMEKKHDYKPLKIYFVEQGIKHQEVSNHLGISQSTMSQIMGGYGRPFTVDEAVKIITKFGGTIELFTTKK